MNKYLIAGAFAFSAFAVSGAAEAKKKPQLTPMEIQALQTKEFETNKETLFASVVSVFQDLGYQLDNADLGSGFITASSASQNKTSFWDAMASQSGSGNTRATAYVEQMPSGMARVRLNFLNSKTTSGMYGGSKIDKPVLEPKTYQIAWEKIDEAIFVRSATSAPAPGPAAGPGPSTTPPLSPAPESAVVPK